MMAANRQKFQAKWKKVLDREHWPAHRYFLDAASDRSEQAETAPPALDPNGKRLLFLYAIPPQFDRQSGDRRLYEMMRAYRDAGHAVTLLAFTSDPVQAQLLERAGITVWHGDSLQMLGEGVTDTLEERVRNGRFDFVYLGSPQMARMYLGFIRNVLPDVPVITDAIDLNFHRLHRDRLINHPPASVVSLPLDRQWEMETYAASDALTSVSEDEAAILRASGITAPIEIVSNFYSEAIMPEPFAKRAGIVIVVNMAHHPNIDALRWFLSEIWPRALRLKPDLQLTICGNGTEALKVDGVPNIAIAGYLPSMNPVFRNARVNIAPLRVGAGVKGKVTEAMRNGLPTVTTPIGAEGLGADSREALLVENDPERFAQALVAVHEDEALWNRISQAGTAFARAHLSREAFMPVLERLLNVRWRAHHSDEAPSIAAIDAAFADPHVGIATFAAGAHRDALTSVLRSEPSVAAIVGSEGAPRVAFSAPGSVPALVISRAAYQCANMRGACSSVTQLLGRAQEHGLVLACAPELPHAKWSEQSVAPLTVDITVPACAQPQRIAAIVQGIKGAANCRLRIAPSGDLSPALPAEVVASADVDGPADVRIFDGPVALPNILGLLNPVGARQTIALDPNVGVDSATLSAHARNWSAHRVNVVAELSSTPDVGPYMKALLKPLESGPCAALLVAHDARHVQLAWSCGMPVTRYFSELPHRVPGAAYLYATSPRALERMLEEERQDVVLDAGHEILAARLGADAQGGFATRGELFDLTMPEWLRPIKTARSAMRSRGTRTVVFVLGMHRSGTSLTTAILHTAGVQLSEDLMAPNEFNRMGYFESSSIAEVHDGILEALGGSWMSSTTLRPFPERWWKRPEIVPFKQRLMEIVERELDAGEYVWGFKDPRTARLLPLWNEIIEEMQLDARFVLAIRDPRDVARSLHAREQLSAVLSELLWLEHNAAVLSVLGNKLHAVASYERWFTDPAGQAKEMLAALDLEIPTDAELQSALTQIVSSELRHHHAPSGAFALPYSGELYQALSEGNRTSAETLAELFNINGVFSAKVFELERGAVH
jgi:glycosyltransferase involved in cell wall biosynthesis